VPGGPTGQFVPLQKNSIGAAQLGQVVQGATTQAATTFIKKGI